MYIRATDFLSLKSKISESVHGKKMSGSSSIKNDKHRFIHLYSSFVDKHAILLQNNFFHRIKAF